MRERDTERALLEAHINQERAQIDAARSTLATGRPACLSDLGILDPQALGLFLTLLGAALVAQDLPDAPVDCLSSDGLPQIRLEPLDDGSTARIETTPGVFSGHYASSLTATLARRWFGTCCGGKYERRIGYAWVEFGRIGEDGEPRYLTLGCGLSALATPPRSRAGSSSRNSSAWGGTCG